MQNQQNSSICLIKKSSITMKKLLINEKNLPRINKQGDSNIRIRVNKTQNPHDSVPIKKSSSSQRQDIDLALQILQKPSTKLVQLDDQKTSLIIQLLKNYKDLLNANQDMMTQSLKFSKLKFKNIMQVEDKENNNLSPKLDKNEIQLPSSDRVSRLMEKPTNSAKTQKTRKYLSTHKKNSEEKGLQDQTDKIQFTLPQLGREEDQMVQSQYIEERAQQSMTQSFNQSYPEQTESQKTRKLEEAVYQLSKKLRERTQQVKELNERIDQLNVNIQNLIKKNSLKSEEFNKLHQEYTETREKIAKSSNMEEELLEIKKKCELLQDEKREVERKRDLQSKETKKILTQKNQKIEQQLGRYQTAQKFYELTRRDLRQQNDNLLLLLQQRERELTNLYQVVKVHEEHSIQPIQPNCSKQVLVL